MKGFPNQVAELTKISKAIKTLVNLVDNGKDARDDGVFGPELVRAGVAGTGHKPVPVERYIQEQLRKTPSNQSFRTTARGLRELFRLLGLINDAGQQVRVTAIGREAAAFANSPLNERQIAFWRSVIRDMTHEDANGRISHPYQVLLRLVARAPGITRAKCALALEARDDTREELDRIVHVARLPEDAICRRIGVTRANWDNAKKVLPKFAEQLGDVIRDASQSYVLADAPGLAVPERMAAEPPPRHDKRRKRGAPAPQARAPQSSRAVTPETIGIAGTLDSFDEAAVPPNTDPESLRAAIRQRKDRLRRHNLIVKALASRLNGAGASLYENPFDVLALVDDLGVLVEVKSLDGTVADERDRVREALAQLLYYEAFVTAAVVGESTIYKIACFESAITVPHQNWLSDIGIASIWAIGDTRFAGNELAKELLSDYLSELA